MTQEFSPITPPPELFAEWLAEAKRLHPKESLGFISGQIAQLAYRSGADQELEACCEWFRVKGYHPEVYRDLRAARRPKPPSLKKQALAALNVIEDEMVGPTTEEKLIRRALEMLPNE